MQKRILSFILCAVMLISMLPGTAMAAIDAARAQRKVYLHAFEGNRPITDTTGRTTINKNDEVNVYLAIDEPNKAANGDKETNEDEMQYNLTGLTVKIYFDTRYFEFVPKDSISPIDYQIENVGPDWGDDDLVEGGNKDEQPQMPGYQVMDTGTYKTDGNADSRMGYAYLTVYYAGKFLPDGDEGNWYNLCKLPLKAIENGPTSVYIDISGDDEYTLELFAKNNPNLESDKLDDLIKNFKYTAENAGYFHFNIEDADRPEVTVTPGTGVYDQPQRIVLEAEGCDIYYTTDQTNPTYDAEGKPTGTTRLYTTPFTISEDTELRVIAVRKKDGRESTIETEVYEILPSKPFLFNSADEAIPPEYNEDWDADGYYVYAADSTAANGDFEITPGNTIYYTFSQTLERDALEKGTKDNPDISATDAENHWKPAVTGTMLVNDPITKTRKIRLVAVNPAGKVSEVAEYQLGLYPGPVTAEPEWGFVNKEKETVRLYCDTPVADIYYTLNDGDPRAEGVGIKYDGNGIPITSDTTIRAASYYDGVWSTTYYTFPYIFTNADKGVTAHYPPGNYEGSVTVTLLPDEPGKKIEYKINDGKWDDYSEPEVIEEDTVITARLEDEPDKEYTFTYKVIPLPPVFAPESTQFTNPDYVAVFAPESNADNTDEFTLKYTLDSSDPINSDLTGDPEFDEANIAIREHTVIKAVVIRNGVASRVVTHTYDVVYDRPATPVTTLTPGYYIRGIDDDTYQTAFDEVPLETKIYYTIGSGGYFADPDPNSVGNGTYEYTPGDLIDITGKTIIKAIAVKEIGGVRVKSDVGIFSYTITPEAPTAPPSSIVDSDELPVIPVDAISAEECMVKYIIDGIHEVEFENRDGERFYINTANGNAYRDAQCQEKLAGLGGTFTNDVTLELSLTLDGISSRSNNYIYATGGDGSELSAPFADKESGTYAENAAGFTVKLDSIYDADDGVKIRYNIGDGWKDYNGTSLTFDTRDTVLYIRTIKNQGTANEKVSAARSYAYTFIPPAPIITPPSGVYPSDTTESVTIDFPANLLGDRYRIHYLRSDALDAWGISNAKVNFSLRDTVGVVAYIENVDTKRTSKVVSADYILEDASVTGGKVWIKEPYNVDRISAHLLGTGEYAKGIKFDRLGSAPIRYQYRFKTIDGAWTAWTNVVTYDELNPIVPTILMKEIEIEVWLEGDEANTRTSYNIEFMHLDVPTVHTVREPDNDGNYTKNTDYYVQNKHAADSSIVVFYTTNGDDDPTLSTSERTAFHGVVEGGEETLTKTTTVKAVYFVSCGSCASCDAGEPHNCIDNNKPWLYGEVGEYVFPVKSTSSGGSSGGGGGGGGSSWGGITTINETRRYTKDIFGYEHPTHIGYINGYPDGSVRPDGYITREEIAAILYRITNHEYESPFVATGEVFPDVEKSRWSVRDIEYMTDKNVIYGYPDGEFKPAQNLTRAEFAALIFRYTGIKESKADNPFDDLEESHWAFDEIIALYKEGIVQGYEDGTFRPQRSITRAEVMTIINKLLGRKPLESYVKSLGFNPYFDLEADKWYYVTVLEATITHNYWLDGKEGYEYKWEDWK